MKKIISILAYFSILFGQFSDPAEFKFNIKNTNQGEVVILEVQASIEDEWHIYAIYDVPEGPEPTVINITSDQIVKTGKIIEPDPIVTYDEGFDNITKYHEGNPLFRVPIILDKNLSNGVYSFDVTVQYQVCTGNLCYPPNEYSETVQFVLESGNIREQFTVNNFDFSKDSVFNRLKLDDSDIGGFLLISLIMPITISFFLKRGEDKKTSPIKDASVYMLGIVMTFTLLGMLLAIFLGASGATQLAANPYVNLFIAFLFIYFAFSLFGFYEIEIPQSLKRFSLERESSEGYAGILFMALTFTLTSFTCTVAFMGTILVAASQGDWFWPIIGMLVFSLAFASPFFFLALFPHYLKKLPQSGGWLNSVKVIMGFLEIAAAFKFISNTDLVWQWDIFTYEIVLYCWAIIMFLCAFYIVGIVRFKYDSKIVVSYQRALASMSFLILGSYLLAGNFGYNIDGNIESYLPPKKVKSNLNWVHSLDDAFIIASEQNKKIFIDFTGVTCTNCRWMETNVFAKKSVEDIMSNFVLVSLYTDSGENYLQKRDYQINRFKTAALPYYVILNKNDLVLGEFPGMTRDIEEFKRFLQEGLN